MNSIKLVTLSLVFILLCSCNEVVKFADPQPIGKRNISKFPSGLWGRYKSMTGNETLEINATSIVYGEQEAATIETQKSDSSLTVQLNNNSHSLSIILNNDSVYGTYIMEDTIFNIKKGNCLRFLKGNYFLNTHLSDGSYEVRMITPGKNSSITLSSIEPDEIENLKAVTQAEEPETLNDSISYLYRPTKKEFKKFVTEMHGFRNKTTFIKIE